VPVRWRVRVGVVASQHASHMPSILLLAIRASVYVVDVLWPATRENPTDAHRVQWRSVSGGCVDVDKTCLSHNTHTCHLSSLPLMHHTLSPRRTSCHQRHCMYFNVLSLAPVQTDILLRVCMTRQRGVSVLREKEKNTAFRVSLVLMTLQHHHRSSRDVGLVPVIPTSTRLCRCVFFTKR
jgi:hypothetical protein